MKITILTLFPEIFGGFENSSVIHRAIEKGIVEIEVKQLRDYSKDKHRHVDDSPFGGGAGMILMCQPIVDALKEIQTEDTYSMILSASGRLYNQSDAHMLARKKHVVLICGRYEGIDARVEKYVDDVVSVGDYVLTGGEIPAMIVADSLIRLLEGVIKEESTQEESYEDGLLEYPQYTQPASFEGQDVPEVLLSGHHANIKEYRHIQALLRTKEKRPDLFEKYPLSEEEKKQLDSYLKNNESES
ncbi:MAG: tRNA (guanosine(37)-N1)-methyltransferase TrmD [Solobacterium sp.]|nr:tRNA (guanosine(37)-N1)-methyltransferase TrmD [Solobacterium sp.]